MWRLTDVPAVVFEVWREDAEELVLWKTDVLGFVDGEIRDVAEDADWVLGQALADARALLAAQMLPNSSPNM